jgi:hypothetical protein
MLISHISTANTKGPADNAGPVTLFLITFSIWTLKSNRVLITAINILQTKEITDHAKLH